MSIYALLAEHHFKLHSGCAYFLYYNLSYIRCRLEQSVKQVICLIFHTANLNAQPALFCTGHFIDERVVFMCE